jgi:hypothetical protein
MCHQNKKVAPNDNSTHRLTITKLEFRVAQPNVTYVIPEFTPLDIHCTCDTTYDNISVPMLERVLHKTKHLKSLSPGVFHDCQKGWCQDEHRSKQFEALVQWLIQPFQANVVVDCNNGDRVTWVYSDMEVMYVRPHNSTNPMGSTQSSTNQVISTQNSTNQVGS